MTQVHVVYCGRRYSFGDMGEAIGFVHELALKRSRRDFGQLVELLALLVLMGL